MNKQKLSFGKYKNRNIIDVWKGCYKESDRLKLQGFIKESIDFFFGLTDYDKKVLSNGYVFTKEDIEFIEYLFINPELRKSVSLNNLKIMINSVDRDFQNKFSDFIIRYFNYSHFTNPHLNALKHPKNENENLDFNIASKIFAEFIPDPNYIRWCFNETDQMNENLIDLQKLKSIDTYYPIIVLTRQSINKINYNLYTHIQYHK